MGDRCFRESLEWVIDTRLACAPVEVRGENANDSVVEQRCRTDSCGIIEVESRP